MTAASLRARRAAVARKLEGIYPRLEAARAEAIDERRVEGLSSLLMVVRAALLVLARPARAQFH